LSLTTMNFEPANQFVDRKRRDWWGL